MAQLVARYLGVVEAASSSLVTQTRKREMSNLPFFSFYRTFSKLEIAKSGAVSLSETRGNRPRKQGWYKIWYIDSKRTFHRSVEAMPETSGKTRIFRCFSGAEFNFQNAKRSKSENEFSDKAVSRLSRHGVVNFERQTSRLSKPPQNCKFVRKEWS